MRAKNKKRRWQEKTGDDLQIALFVCRTRALFVCIDLIASTRPALERARRVECRRLLIRKRVYRLWRSLQRLQRLFAGRRSRNMSGALFASSSRRVIDSLADAKCRRRAASRRRSRKRPPISSTNGCRRAFATSAPTSSCSSSSEIRSCERFLVSSFCGWRLSPFRPTFRLHADGDASKAQLPAVVRAHERMQRERRVVAELVAR